jgi:hypothetical protein
LRDFNKRYTNNYRRNIMIVVMDFIKLLLLRRFCLRKCCVSCVDDLNYWGLKKDYIGDTLTNDAVNRLYCRFCRTIVVADQRSATTIVRQNLQYNLNCHVE